MESLSPTQLLNYCSINKAIDYALEAPIYAGVAIAVAGVALTIISGLSLGYTAAFALLAGICVLGIYHARKSQLLKVLQEKIDSLEKLCQDLEGTNKKLKINVDDFSSENRELHKQVGCLTANVEHLTETVNQAKHILRDFQEERARLATQNSAIADITKRLEKSAADAIKKMEQQLEQSQRMLESAREILKEEVAKSVEELTEQIKSATHESRLQLCSQISKAQGELQAVQEQFAREREQLASVRRDLETTEGKLRKVREEIAIETQRLSGVAKRVEGAVDTHLGKRESGFRQAVWRENPLES